VPLHHLTRKQIGLFHSSLDPHRATKVRSHDIHFISQHTHTADFVRSMSSGDFTGLWQCATTSMKETNN